MANSYVASLWRETKEGLIQKRNGGCGAVFQGMVYIWGGQSYEEEEDDDYDEVSRNYFDLPRDSDRNNTVDVYDVEKRLWWQHPTGGDVPCVGLGSRLVAVSATLYLYGGWNNYQFSSDLFRLDLCSFNWVKISPKTHIKPTPVYLTTAVTYRNSICTFGGVGLYMSEEKRKESGAEYDQVSETPRPWGFNSEYHEFDVETGDILL